MAELRRGQRERYVTTYSVYSVYVRGLGMVLLALCEFLVLCARLYRSMRSGKMVWNSV